MKKFLAVFLASAMLIPLLVSCGSLRGSELDEEYPQAEINIQNASADVTVGYSGSTEINTATDMYDAYFSVESRDAVLGEWFAVCNTGTFEVSKDLGQEATADYYPEYLGKKIYEVDTAEQLASFFYLLSCTVDLESGDTPDANVVAAGFSASGITKKPWFDFSDKVIVLNRDFDLTDCESIVYPADGSAYFNGVFDGRGHVVAGRSVRSTADLQQASLFGVLVEATVKNVAFVDCTVDDGLAYGSSGLAVWSAGEVVIDGVYLDAKLLGGDGNIGGVIGSVKAGSLAVHDSTVEVSFRNGTGNSYGGVIGSAASVNISIQNCRVLCDMQISNQVSAGTTTMVDADGDGMVDQDENGKAMYTVSGYKTSSGENYGGMVGFYQSTSTKTSFSIADSLVSGSIVVCGTNVGGVVGHSYTESNSSVSAAFDLSNTVSDMALSLGNVSFVAAEGEAYYSKVIGADKKVSYVAFDPQVAVDYAYAQTSYWGGMIGYREKTGEVVLTDCTNNGDILGYKQIGGMIGSKAGVSGGRGFQLNNCINNGDITAIEGHVGGLVGYITQCPLTVLGGANNGVIQGNATVGGGFGAIGGKAENAALIDGFTNNGSVSGTQRVGGVVASKGNNTSSFANLYQLTVQNCTNTGAVSATAEDSYVAGIIGYVGGGHSANNTKKLTVSNCINSGAITGQNYTAGIMGLVTRLAYVSNNQEKVYNAAGAIEISGCANSGVIQGAGYVAGIVACPGNNASKAVKTTIQACINTGSVEASDGYAAGILAWYSGKEILIDNCCNEASIKGTSHSAGIVGSICNTGSSPIGSVTVTYCTASGIFTLGGSSGGIIGDVQYATKVAVENCSVSAAMEFYYDGTADPNVGGLVGQISECGTSTVTGCDVTGSIYLKDLVGTDSEGDAVSVRGGGLIGAVRKSGTTSSASVSVSDCLVSLDFDKEGFAQGDTDEVLEVFVGANDTVDTLTANFSDMQYFAREGDVTNDNVTNATELTERTIKAVGQQYKYDEATNTYALRYVFGVSDLSDMDKAIGFDVTVTYTNGSAREITVYCPNLYDSINGGDRVYHANDEAIGVDYLFTLTIEGIPADQIMANGAGVCLKDAVMKVDSFTAYSQYAKFIGASVTVAAE